MNPARLDRVQVTLSRGPVELPWDSRDALLDQFLHLDSMKPILDAFEAVGASTPVKLTQEQKSDLLGVIEFWMNQVGQPQLPAGVFELRNALHDLHDAQQRRERLP